MPCCSSIPCKLPKQAARTTNAAPRHCPQSKAKAQDKTIAAHAMNQLDQALQLAQQATAYCRPNPRVGCVIV
ncbi:MAG: hypothetical protein KA455_06300, partial [Brachymonas sp.]|nr:hypothetical protein [Brachymonas sp.]